MPRTGRPPQPRALKLVKGERKDRVNDEEPIPSSGEVVAPPWFAEDGGEDAHELWNRLGPDLIAKGVLTPWDVDAFARFCVAMALYHQARRQLAVEGPEVDYPVFDRNGKETGFRRMKSNWLSIRRDAVAEADALGAKFGLTPSDRTRLKVGSDGESKNPKERLLS